jgi:hypothetical protein
VFGEAAFEIMGASSIIPRHSLVSLEYIKALKESETLSATVSRLEASVKAQGTLAEDKVKKLSEVQIKRILQNMFSFLIVSRSIINIPKH